MQEKITIYTLFQMVILFYEEISKDKELIHSDMISELKRFQFKVLQWSKNRSYHKELIESIQYFFEEEYLVRGYLEGIFLKDSINELWITFNENDEALILKK